MLQKNVPLPVSMPGSELRSRDPAERGPGVVR